MTRRVPAARRWLPWVIAATSGFVLAFAAAAIVLWPEGGDTEVTIPLVVGLPYPDAERRLVAAGLEVTLGEQRPSADAPRNAVVAQDPAAGEVVEGGTEVVLHVSEGAPLATVPALVGLSRDDAERVLRDAALALAEVAEVASDTARGTVLATSPGAGSQVPRGTRVILTVSTGPTELLVPDLVGRSESAARGLLEQLGFAIAPPEYDSLSTLPAGTVLAQSPAAGAAAPGGSVVTLRISGRP